jgi:hypothetical protein
LIGYAGLEISCLPVMGTPTSCKKRKLCSLGTGEVVHILNFKWVPPPSPGFSSEKRPVIDFSHTGLWRGLIQAGMRWEACPVSRARMPNPRASPSCPPLSKSGVQNARIARALRGSFCWRGQVPGVHLCKTNAQPHLAHAGGAPLLCRARDGCLDDFERIVQETAHGLYNLQAGTKCICADSAEATPVFAPGSISQLPAHAFAPVRLHDACMCTEEAHVCIATASSLSIFRQAMLRNANRGCNGSRQNVGYDG